MTVPQPDLRSDERKLLDEQLAAEPQLPPPELPADSKPRPIEEQIQIREHPIMNRRSGSSLVEVLIAIFVMGLGLMALLTLFPIGMLRMAQAIRSAKCTNAATNAHTLSIVNNTRMDPTVLSDAGPPGISDMFANPNPAGPFAFKPADPFGESYAIFVDPIGSTNAGTATQKDWVGTGGGPPFGEYLRRRRVNYAPTALAQYKLFTLLDDIRFESTNDPTASPPAMPGAPYRLSGAPNLLFRVNRYSWAYLLRRPQTGDPSIVDCTIVVYEARNTLTLPEYVYPPAIAGVATPTCFFDLEKNSITIDYTTNVPPPIRPGNWLLDATILPDVTGKFSTQHAYFYKVVSVEEMVITGPRNLVRYEVANPIRGFAGPRVVDPSPSSPNLLGVYPGTVIVLEDVAEVYEKGPARLP